MSEIFIENNGQEIVRTNYWDSPQFRDDFPFLSWNAGAARLLMPYGLSPMLSNMLFSSEVIVSRGPLVNLDGRDGLELLWVDGNEVHMPLLLDAGQCDQMAPDTEQDAGFIVAVWTVGGFHNQWPGRYRLVSAIPCLKPWAEPC